MTNPPIRIAPSKLNYWGTYNCLKCYAATLHGWRKPREVFSPIWSRLDGHQKTYFKGRSTAAISPDLPPGVIHGGYSVKSAPYVGPNGVQLVIGGNLDAVCEFEDGSLGVVDLKTSASKLESLADGYRNQLACYAYALENPDPEKHEPRDVSTSGLVIVRPESMVDTNHGTAEIVSTTWIEVRWDEAARKSFIGVLNTVCEIYANPDCAPSVDGCEWCDIREKLAA